MSQSELHKLGNLTDFIAGKNVNRLTSNLNEYSVQEFEYDYAHPYEGKMNFSVPSDPNMITPGDIIINLQTGKAAIAGEKSHKKFFSQNFSKVVFKKEFPVYYFLYLMNEDKNFQKEKKIYSTGSVIKRLTNSGLEECSVKRFSLKEEEAIGDIYMSALKIKTQATEQAEKILAINLEILNQYVNSENKTLKEGK